MPDDEKTPLSAGTIIPGARGMGILLFIGFVVTSIILFTDQNLMNDFGSYTGSGYYFHWYGLLVTALIDLVGGIRLLTHPFRGSLALGLVWSIFMVAFLFGDTLLYSQVGFTTMSQFYNYLFGLSKSPGSESYYPGLYDALVGIFVIGIVYSGLDLTLHKRKKVA